MPPNVFRTLGPVQVEVKRLWGDAWDVKPNIIPVSASLAAGGVGQFQFDVPYGILKHPSESTIGPHDYTDIDGDWVRVKRAPYTDADILWLGKIDSDSRQLHGTDLGIPSGYQRFTAYDGVHILGKRMVTQTIERVPGVDDDDEKYQRLEVFVPFNGHPYDMTWHHNRSANRRSSGNINHYVFSAMTGRQMWRVGDAIEYIVAEFLNGSGNASTEPQWALQYHGALDRVLHPQNWKSPISVLELINQLIGKQYGWGWCAIPTATGYTLRFATLTATPVLYKSFTIPANPWVVAINNNDPDTRITIERSLVDRYKTIRVLGAPMVIVRSFAWDHPDIADESLFDGWSEGDESVFAFASDRDRTSGLFSNVWQRFLVNMDDKVWEAYHCPIVDDDGEVDPTILGPLPTLIASTMDHLPLYESVDYSEVPPAPTEDETRFSSYMPPQLWMKAQDGEQTFFADVVRYAGASLIPHPTNLGITAQVADPSIFGAGSPHKARLDNPIFDANTAILTIAFEVPQRLQLVYQVPGAVDADGVLDIEVPNAQLWYAPRDTVYGIENNELLQFGEDVTLRNDKELLYGVMAGAITRYANSRNRAMVSATGLHPWHNSLLYICGAVADDTDASQIAAPITHVSWQFSGDYMTTFSTGYAL